MTLLHLLSMSVKSVWCQGSPVSYKFPSSSCLACWRMRRRNFQHSFPEVLQCDIHHIYTVPGSPSYLNTGGIDCAMVCTCLGSLLRPLFYFLCSNLKAKPVQCSWSGYPTGNGKKLSRSQAQLGQATCLAVAYFLSIFCGPSTPSAL